MRLLSDTLRDIGAGALNHEASEALSSLVQAVDEHGKAGALTIKINLKPAGHRSSGTLTVSYDVSVKKPSGERPSQIMWGTPEGALLAADPRQQALDLREVPRPAAELKTVNG